MATPKITMSSTPNPRRLQIAFTMSGGAGWMGGVLYLKNLFTALRALEATQRPVITLLVQDEAPLDDAIAGLVDRTLQVPPALFRPDLRQRVNSRVQRHLGVRVGGQSALTTYLRRHQVDIVFAQAHFGTGFALPLLGWIPDFRHLHLPATFTPDEVAGRNKFYRDIAQYADRVIVSSQDSLRDLMQFAPLAAPKGRVLSFVAQLPEQVFETDPRSISQHYHLPDSFFYLPNQFWKHKNHRVVIQALEILKTSCPQAVVVCTGNTTDAHNPAYFSQLLADISAKGLRHNMVILGVIPHEHLFSLMRQSLAVLQPSLFEGWSTTVEEAKSAGKTLVLSDIAIHREQNPRQALFFDPADPAMLADCLEKVVQEKTPGPDAVAEDEAHQDMLSRTRLFSQTFMAIAQEVVPA